MADQASVPNPTDIDFTNFDPEKMDIGTALQDCMLIVQIYERGAHSTFNEAAVYAPLAHNLENAQAFADHAADSMATYLRTPAVDTQVPTDSTTALQGLTFGNTSVSVSGSTFGKDLLDWAQNCIPCMARIVALMELHPHVDLLGALEADIVARLSFLNDLTGLLSNTDMYNDFCALLNALSFMCIPDLQRIIALLATLLAFQGLELDGLIGMLQALIAPLFMPILSAITSLLDQFSLLVVSPMDCILDAINEELRKGKSQVSWMGKMASEGGDAAVSNAMKTASGGLEELSKAIVDAKKKVHEKVQFYIDQMKALLGELNGGDIAYLKGTLRKLTIVRLIGFVTAVITAISKGQSLCSSGSSNPSKSELDTFFADYLNPSSPFQFSVDDNGNIHIDEVLPTTLQNQDNVAVFDGGPLLDPQVVQTIQTSLEQPIQAVITCRFSTTKDEAEQVNEWIEELNKL